MYLTAVIGGCVPEAVPYVPGHVRKASAQTLKLYNTSEGDLLHMMTLPLVGIWSIT